ncbi:TraY domain-containing protein (plasmid) [Enterobacteriaceae bacterium Kacie_13]|nr:TraY domain-containing protein [Enterobacteriaceae bacterium Kacie_13]
MSVHEYRSITLVVKLTSDMNEELTTSASESNRSKAREAELRLRDHLKNFKNIACEGERVVRG